MKEAQGLVRAFHDHYLGDNQSTPALCDVSLLDLRVRLVEEEAGELAEAVRDRDIVGIADALADLLYVIIGTACVLGIDLDPVFAEVHRSNMTKQAPPGGRGKPIKGEGFQEPDLESVLIRQGWQPDDGAKT